MLATVDVVVPDLGLAAGDDRLLVNCWLANVGDQIVEGDRLVELAWNDVTIDLPSPASGKLTRIVCGVDDNVRVGGVLARIRVEGE